MEWDYENLFNEVAKSLIKINEAIRVEESLS